MKDNLGVPCGTGHQPTASAASASSQSGVPDAVSLSAIERETFSAWKDCSEGYGFGFRRAAKNCSTPPHQIRRAVRSLARKGLLEYQRALFFEDEDCTMGAGYVLTFKGWEMLRDR